MFHTFIKTFFSHESHFIPCFFAYNYGYYRLECPNLKPFISNEKATLNTKISTITSLFHIKTIVEIRIIQVINSIEKLRLHCK